MQQRAGSRGSKGSVQSLCGHKDGARTDGLWALCAAPAPPEYFTQSLLIIWPGSPDVQGSGDLLNICNGRRKKGRKVSLVMVTLVTSDLCYVNTNIMST